MVAIGPELREDAKSWIPLALAEVHLLFAAACFPWWLAGGHALEQFAGVPIREHGDIDLFVLRRDAERVRALLAGWDLWMADPPGQLRPWRTRERLPRRVSDIWCRRDPNAPWSLQLMLDDAAGDRWRSRRTPNVSLPLSAIGWESSAGMPVLKPEVQLFYKAKSPRAKDQVDFEACLPRLSDEQVAWLRAAIAVAYPADNEWRQRLASLGVHAGVPVSTLAG